MRIVIAGAGDVGFHVTKLLSYENQDIGVIDTDQEKLAYVSNHLDVATVQGSSTSHAVLTEAKVSKADLLIAVTSSEEINLTTCILAKYLGAKRTIARISNVEFLLKRDRLDLRKLGIDEIILPASLAAREIKRLLKQTALTDTFEFDNGLLTLVGVNINGQSPLIGKSMKEFTKASYQQDNWAVAILRNNQTIIPHGDTTFERNDHAYFISQPQGVNSVLKLSGNRKVEIKNIMIMGGSDVGYNAARRLSKIYKVKLVEKDRDRCLELAEILPDTLIINGDGRDVDLLKEEGITDMDAFLSLTSNSDTNIISSLVAKNHGVSKTISLVENIDYIHLSQNIGVDTLINKKLIAANFIFRYIRRGQVVSLTSIHGVDAEVLEFEVQENSKITKKILGEINFPSNAVVGGVIRNGAPFTAMGDFEFEPKDRVVVLSRPDCIHSVEAFFK